MALSFSGPGRWRRARRWLAARWNARFGDADVSIFFDFVPPPYGGGNQFLLALKGELERQGVRVGVNYVGPRTRAVLVNSMQVDETFLRSALRADVRVVHRVDGPISVYRGERDAAVDREIAALNARIAHATVLQSRYSADEHARLGLQFASPEVVPNAPDPALFHPPEARAPLEGRKLKVISTAWSDNPNKGAAVYAWLDRNLDFSRIEYTFVGRIGVPLEKIKVISPLPSTELGGVLRAHDVYVTASLHESCSNALLEALACGLPAVYASSGSNGELVSGGGLPFREAADVPGLLERIREDIEVYRARIFIMPLAEVARRYRAVLSPP